MSRSLALAVALLLALAPATLAGATPAPRSPFASLPEQVRSRLPGCACAKDLALLQETREAIAAAPDLESARERALAEVRSVQRALRGARWLAPKSESLAAAEQRIERYAARVESAETPEAAASEFGALVQLASLGSPVLADVDIDIDPDGDGCQYSSGEIVAIVLGLILGIIPGIILLILLC